VNIRSSLTARMVMLGAALAVVVGLAIGAMLLTIGDMRHAARMARHSAQVLAGANLAEKQLLDLETGGRGFALTRDEQFLQPWRSARASLPRQTERLSALVADNPSQEALVQQIGAGIRGYVDEYSIPLVTSVRRQGRPPPAAEGKRRVDAIRAQFARFDATEQALADRRRAASDHAAARAVTVGVIVLVLGVALLLAFAAYLGRAVATPVRRVAEAADRLAAGDLGARVPVSGRDELARLAGSFNAMGDALQDRRDELNSQHSELELQTAELEDQQAQLSTANDELRAQRDELEDITASLADETERQRVFGDFGEALAAFAALEARARTTLRALAETAGAQVGALYAADDASAHGFELLDTLGLERDGLPAWITPDHGLAGRALAERGLVQAGHEDATMRMPSLGGETTVRHELHVPLVYGERTIGVVSLGRTEAGTIDRRACERLDHLADQGAVALANAFVTRRAQRLADINRAVLDTVRDGIMLANEEGIVLANEPARRLTEEILGVPFEEAAGLDPTQVAARTTDAESYLAANAAIAADPDEPTFDEVELAESGRVFQRYTAPVRGADGERLGRTTVIREVTAEREGERLKEELMATVSHELRTPLASIVGFTELLLLRDPEPDVRRSHLETVHAEARRLAELIDDFLDLQRISERGQLPLDRRRLDLRPLVSDQARVFAAQSRAHSLAVRMPEDALVAEADPSRLKQVLANLLSNAIKYSPDGGEIAVDGWVRNGVVGVAISDPGLGIPSAAQDRVFERFYRAPGASERAIGGTGLGLALSREIVEAHDGTIGFESVEGKGSRFWFELPAAGGANGSNGSNGSSG
jgi:signal transduction histidine kinase/CHASE3 domain sensor protein